MGRNSQLQVRTRTSFPFLIPIKTFERNGLVDQDISRCLYGQTFKRTVEILIQETLGLYLDRIQEWLLLYHDLDIPTTALHDNLRDLGLTRKLTKRAAAERGSRELRRTYAGRCCWGRGQIVLLHCCKCWRLAL
ncbi:hypothetical protein BD779DRAFT_1533989 [Infundibulicybe gibba]|nr:hypothetical protein BD779DRAFT_1533989 [Infundibulicybe gibba]